MIIIIVVTGDHRVCLATIKRRHFQFRNPPAQF